MTASGRNFDVVVAGGGPAGICAAVQAARTGAATLLVEKTALLGGAITSGGVAFPGIFHAHGRQVIAGIGWDLVRRTIEEVGGEMPDFSRGFGKKHWTHQIRIDGAAFAALVDEEVTGSGAQLLLHAMPAAARRAADGSWELDLCLKEGLRTVGAKTLVDATGDANLAALAGCRLERGEVLQPGTLMMRCGGYDPKALDYPALEAALGAAVERGEISFQDLGRKDDACRMFLTARGQNRNHIVDVDGYGSEGRTAAELAARRSMLRILRFFRRQPGLESFRVESFAPECGIRETRTVAGRARITGRDYMAGRIWPDALCYAFYPIDIHTDDGLDVDMRHLADGVVPTVPRGALLPEGVGNFLVAGRIISSDRESNSALRVQGTCMATGQAAGALAALAAKSGRAPEELPLAEVRKLLRDNGAIVPDGGDAQ